MKTDAGVQMAKRTSAAELDAEGDPGRSSPVRSKDGNRIIDPMLSRDSGVRFRLPTELALASTIEDQIIPRLLLAHREPLARDRCGKTRREPPRLDEIIHFARLAVAQDMGEALGVVEAMCRDGLSLPDLLLGLVAPTARRLGEDWLEDRCSFSDVTVGLGTLQRIVAVLGQKSETPVSRAGMVVLAAAPGEQHVLSLHVLAEFARQAGWAVHVDPGMDEGELVDLVASEHVTAVGVTVSNRGLASGAQALLGQARRYSRNPNLRIALGGAADGLRELASEVGADYLSDAKEFVRYLGEIPEGVDRTTV
ncbi:MAG: hypothetical protein CMN29_05845 [Sandaracinus sp.]|nr:hypothetical protein [Sandaracinus sp.]